MKKTLPANEQMFNDLVAAKEKQEDELGFIAAHLSVGETHVQRIRSLSLRIRHICKDPELANQLTTLVLSHSKAAWVLWPSLVSFTRMNTIRSIVLCEPDQHMVRMRLYRDTSPMEKMSDLAAPYQLTEHCSVVLLTNLQMTQIVGFVPHYDKPAMRFTRGTFPLTTALSELVTFAFHEHHGGEVEIHGSLGLSEQDAVSDFRILIDPPRYASKSVVVKETQGSGVLTVSFVVLNTNGTLKAIRRRARYSWHDITSLAEEIVNHLEKIRDFAKKKKEQASSKKPAA
jgi:hypothetical protein